MIWRSESIILPPLFYLVAAEKEQLKTFGRWCTSKFQMCRNNSVYPLVVWIRIALGQEHLGRYVHARKCLPSWSFADSKVEIKCDVIFCSIYLKLVIHQGLWFINKTLLLCWHIPRLSIYPMTTWGCNTTALPHTFSVSSSFMIYSSPPIIKKVQENIARVAMSFSYVSSH